MLVGSNSPFIIVDSHLCSQEQCGHIHFLEVKSGMSKRNSSSNIWISLIWTPGETWHMKICQEFYSEYKTHNDLGSIYSTSWGPISTCSNAENKRLDAAWVPKFIKSNPASKSWDSCWLYNYVNPTNPEMLRRTSEKIIYLYFWKLSYLWKVT